MRVLAAACLWLLGLACAASEVAGELRPIPDKPEDEQFKDAPEPWRGYLIKARAAERIEDPLQRCLAYPDLPGNQWPQGHAEAHCRVHAIRVIDLEEIDAYLQRGDVAGLETRLDAYLARHFSRADHGEDIHFVFDHFSVANEQVDRISAKWLEMLPDSAYANLARGQYYRNLAWKSRGGKWASETPGENMRRMGGYAEMAIPHLRKAVDQNPRLMPAYVALLDIGMLDSRRRLAREAVERAAKHDPTCMDMARQRMRAAQPRWGGDYNEMLSIASELSQYVAMRPHLAIHVAAPYGDRGDRLSAEKQYTREAVDVLDIAIRIGSNESHMRDAARVALNLPMEEGGPDSWKALSLLLQESRFNAVSVWANSQIAWHLVRVEPEWSLRHSSRVYADDPENTFGNYVLAAAYNNTGQYEAAEKHYLVSAEGEGQRLASLRELSSMWLYGKEMDRKQAAAKAKPYIDRLLQVYPNDGRGWLYRIEQEAITNGRIEQERFERFLAVADRDDPMQAHAATRIEAMLEEMGASGQPRRRP